MQKVLVTNNDDGTTVIAINRPERRNAICSQTAIELQQAFAAFDASEQKVAVLTGSGDEAFPAARMSPICRNCGAAFRRWASPPKNR